MKLKTDIQYKNGEQMVEGVDVRLSPLEFLVVHALIKENFDNSTDADETYILGNMLDDIDNQLEEEIFNLGIEL